MDEDEPSLHALQRFIHILGRARALTLEITNRACRRDLNSVMTQTDERPGVFVQKG